MANFSVAARTLIHLGAELITSDEVAINELVKNAFDAESKRVKINFFIPISHVLIDECLTIILNSTDDETLQNNIASIKKMLIDSVSEPSVSTQVEEVLLSLSSSSTKDEARKIIESLNYITIEDSGCGMDLATLESVFLAIGTPSKVNSESTKDLNRKILGNKGIGRLAMMKIGDIANVTSWVEDGQAHEIEFDWRLFDDPVKVITDIQFEIKPTTCSRQTPSGTVIKITALKSPWTEEKVRERLVGDFFRRLQNPFVMSLDEEASDNSKKK